MRWSKIKMIKEASDFGFEVNAKKLLLSYNLSIVRIKFRVH
jgi:predicted ABC-type ATPase